MPAYTFIALGDLYDYIKHYPELPYNVPYVCLSLCGYAPRRLPCLVVPLGPTWVTLSNTGSSTHFVGTCANLYPPDVYEVYCPRLTLDPSWYTIWARV